MENVTRKWCWLVFIDGTPREIGTAIRIMSGYGYDGLRTNDVLMLESLSGEDMWEGFNSSKNAIERMNLVCGEFHDKFRFILVEQWHIDANNQV